MIRYTITGCLALLTISLFVFSCSPKASVAAEEAVTAPAPTASNTATTPTTTTVTSTVAASAPTETDTTLLWAISGNGLAATSYLFGTIHMIPEEDFFMPATVETALAATDKVAFEIDMAEMQDPSIMLTMMSRIQMPNGKKLSDLIEPEEYTIVQAYFDSTGMPLAFFENWKPMFLATMVGQDLEDLGGMMDGIGGMRSYEFELTEMAESAKKEIFGLETIDFQLSVFDSIPYDFQANMLLEAIEADMAGNTEDDQFGEMVEMYRRQAISEMVSMIQEEAGADDEANFEEFLLTRRNAAWIPLMAESMTEGPVFFAVGAGHLAGEKGVIKLLREAGYSVEGVYAKAD
ncbi:MAG: TraB/GumN family protein [Bacteroidota bacterium]